MFDRIGLYNSNKLKPDSQIRTDAVDPKTAVRRQDPEHTGYDTRKRKSDSDDHDVLSDAFWDSDENMISIEAILEFLYHFQDEQQKAATSEEGTADQTDDKIYASEEIDNPDDDVTEQNHDSRMSQAAAAYGTAQKMTSPDTPDTMHQDRKLPENETARDLIHDLEKLRIVGVRELSLPRKGNILEELRAAVSGALAGKVP